MVLLSVLRQEYLCSFRQKIHACKVVNSMLRWIDDFPCWAANLTYLTYLDVLYERSSLFYLFDIKRINNFYLEFLNRWICRSFWCFQNGKISINFFAILEDQWNREHIEIKLSNRIPDLLLVLKKNNNKWMIKKMNEFYQY